MTLADRRGECIFSACQHYRKCFIENTIRRARKAESLGLTYREYMLELLERGRYLQVEDGERIAQIIARRRGGA